MILSTTSQTIVSVLGREAHQKAMAEVLAGLGVREFEVRLAEKAPQTRDAIEELKANFKDYPIEIK